MRVVGLSSLLLLAAGAVQAASSWSFDDGAVSISSKKGGEADKETYVQQPPPPNKSIEQALMSCAQIRSYKTSHDSHLSRRTRYPYRLPDREGQWQGEATTPSICPAQGPRDWSRGSFSLEC